MTADTGTKVVVRFRLEVERDAREEMEPLLPQDEGSVRFYEPALRVIGRHLDTEPAYHVSILEVDDGFTVRYHPTQHRLEGKTVRFPSSRIQDLFVFQSAGRGCLPKHDRHEGMWDKFHDGHQEFLRALGYLLDQEGASGLTLDELPDEVRVTYIRPEPAAPFRTEKRSLVFAVDDVRALVAEARQRRSERLSFQP